MRLAEWCLLYLAVKALGSKIKLQAVTGLVLTHLTPKRLPTLIEVLKQITSPNGTLKVYLSNPAMQLLRSSLGALHDSSPTAALGHSEHLGPCWCF